jgi:hypothetical protein
MDAPAASLADQEYTPVQLLALCLATIRGGHRVPYDVLQNDVVLWIRDHGKPTAEKVEKWANESFELGLGLNLLRKRHCIEDE